MGSKGGRAGSAPFFIGIFEGVTMLDWISRNETWLDRLQRAHIPVVLYGMGNGADKIFELLDARQVAVADVFASDEFVRGQIFHGFQVKRYRDILAKYGRRGCIVVLAFATSLPEVMGRIRQIGEEQELIVPDLPVVGTEIFDLAYVERMEERIAQCYQIMADGQSRSVFAGLCNFRLSGKLSDLDRMETPVREAYELLEIGRQERYLDLGAYDGDTLRELLEIAGGYDRAIALEPDPKNYAKLERFAMESNLRSVHLIQAAASRETRRLSFEDRAGRNSALSGDGRSAVQAYAVDELPCCRDLSYVKLDIEGAEADAIWGMKNLLMARKPKLRVCAYHRTQDFFDLPLLIKQINPDYRCHLRKHPYIPGFEVNLYAK